jgi:hypothetical protein
MCSKRRLTQVMDILWDILLDRSKRAAGSGGNGEEAEKRNKSHDEWHISCWYYCKVEIVFSECMRTMRRVPYYQRSINEVEVSPKREPCVKEDLGLAGPLGEHETEAEAQGKGINQSRRQFPLMEQGFQPPQGHKEQIVETKLTKDKVFKSSVWR